MLEALKWTLLKYGMIEDIQVQKVDMIFIFIVKYKNVIISRGMQH
jgi:hypothetical protein